MCVCVCVKAQEPGESATQTRVVLILRHGVPRVFVVFPDNCDDIAVPKHHHGPNTHPPLLSSSSPSLSLSTSLPLLVSLSFSLSPSPSSLSLHFTLTPWVLSFHPSLSITFLYLLFFLLLSIPVLPLHLTSLPFIIPNQYLASITSPFLLSSIVPSFLFSHFTFTGTYCTFA